MAVEEVKGGFEGCFAMPFKESSLKFQRSISHHLLLFIQTGARRCEGRMLIPDQGQIESKFLGGKHDTACNAQDAQKGLNDERNIVRSLDVLPSHYPAHS